MQKRGTGKTKRTPVIDAYECNDCGSCLELFPAVFKRNEETGSIEVCDVSCCSEEELRDAISNCPKNCIAWQEA
ncbi:MAG: ferredoxin [Thermodesulfobacteriota bacterium]|nr:ferredoxin [Thermodesulfobacteriota bacterium]